MIREELVLKLLGYNDKPIELTKDDLFFLNKTKMNGIIFDYLKDSNIKIEPQLLESLKELKKFNYIRNINLLKKAINIDFYLEENGIKRVWIKGIAEVFNNPSYLWYRKQFDIDILVDDPYKTKSLMMDYGFVYGAYDLHGNGVTTSEIEIDRLEKEGYELFPLTKNITLGNLHTDVNKDTLILQRIFNEGDTFFTDVCIDIHKELTFDLKPEWLMKDSFFPFMDEIDEIWYLLNKSFYEQIKGHSLNLQSLVGVLKKIRNTKFTREEIVDRLDLIGFYNEEAVNTMFDL